MRTLFPLPIYFSLRTRHFSLNSKLRPYRRVIGRFLAFAHFAINPRSSAFFRELIDCENCVDAEAAIFFKRAHLIIPPAEQFAFFVMNSQCIVKTDFA